MNNVILLHACCAVCLGYPIKLLKEMGYSPAVYFYNPNIYPRTEWERRLDELEKICDKEKITLIKEKYSPDDFYEISKGFEKCLEKGERCKRCFELRLLKTACKAKELGILKVCTTLTVSPHKSSKTIFEVEKNLEKQACIEFLKIDFKKNDGFKITQKIADENNLYKQTYCGCQYSIR